MKADERMLRTAARYLGYAHGLPDPQGVDLLLRAWDDMLRHAKPVHIIKRGRLCSQGGAFAIEGLQPVDSADLCQLTRGCDEALGLLATLGMPLDLRVRRLMVSDPGFGAAVGACASVYVDEYIDGLLAGLGLALTPRFSPGYGDVPLAWQQPFLRWLDAQRIGVVLTQGDLMVPVKTVSAIVGIRRGAS